MGADFTANTTGREMSAKTVGESVSVNMEYGGPSAKIAGVVPSVNITS